MLPERDRAAIEDMLQYAQEAASAGTDRLRGDLDTDRFLYLGLQRLIAIIGEAATKVSPDARERHSEVPWAVIIGMRHRLVHGYDVVDADVVWDTVTIDLPPLLAQLREIVAQDS